MKKFYFLTILMSILIVKLNAQQWTSVTTPHPSVEHMAVTDNKLFIATSIGVYSSADGTTWNMSSTGMTPVYSNVYYILTIYNFDDVMYAGAMGKLYKSVDFGANWIELVGAAPNAGVQNSSIYVKGDTIIAGWKNYEKLYKSIDGGTTWTHNDTVHGNPSKNIVELNNAFYIRNFSGVHKSTDLCESFTTLTGTPVNMNDGSLAVSNGVLICGTCAGSIYRSDDEGDTWTETITTYQPLYLEVIGGTLYMGTDDSKVFSSINNGASWTDLTGTGITSSDVHSFAVFNGNLYASAANVLYRRTITTSINESVRAENLFSFYPTPSNDFIIISSPEKFSNATIKIYTISGVLLIEKIINEKQQQTIDIENLSNGVYIIEVDQNGIIARQKLIKN